MDRLTTLDKHWKWGRDDLDIVWLTFDKQGESANTLSREALVELDRSLDAIRALQPKGMVIRSAKDSGFVAGADVQEFMRVSSPQEALAFVRLGWEVFQKLRELPFPTTAMVAGFCIGGGVELALACRYRVALDDPRTRFALPEVMLGILPGWHGLQWLPRLIGPAAALDLILSGKSIDARRAKRLGLVDEAVPLRVLENAARTVTLEAGAPRKLPWRQALLLREPLRSLLAAQARKQLSRRVRREHYPAPFAILQLWRDHDGNPLRAPAGAPCSIQYLAAHPTTKNLLRVFFLQERLKAQGKAEHNNVRQVHVVGAGVMGGDIAAVCALRGLRVTLQDTAPERIAPAVKRAARLFERRLRDPRRVRDALDRLIPDVAGAGAARADLVIEAIFENLDAKRRLFAKLESCARPDAILATNTSSLRLADIGSVLRDPSRLVGIHFFNPVPRMQLVEVVSAVHARPELASRAAAFARAIDKLPLPVKDAPGFLVNRVLGPYMKNAFHMLEEGIKPETIDTAMEAFGMPMGPIELADTVGLDICLAAGKALAHGDAQAPQVLTNKVALGHLGKKTGQGIYRYVDGKALKGAPGPFDDPFIEAVLEPYLLEARAAVAEGVAPDADLADAGLIFGSGFAPFRGGPLHYLSQAKRRPV